MDRDLKAWFQNSEPGFIFYKPSLHSISPCLFLKTNMATQPFGVGYETGFQEGSGVKPLEVVNSDTFKFIERKIATTSKGDKRTDGQEGLNEPMHSLYQL